MSAPLPSGARRRFLLAAGAGAVLALSPRLAGAKVGAARPVRIYMVTWRGATDVEKGFVDYWKTRPDPAEFILRDAAQSRERLVEIAADIEQVRPDLVLTWGTSATLGIAGAADKPHPLIGRRIPLVFAMVADPVAANVVKSLAAHGRNIAGVSHVAPLAAQIEAMRAYRPIASVGLIYNKLEANSVSTLEAWRRAGAAGKIPVFAESFPVDARNRLLPAHAETTAEMVRRIAASGANWLYLGPDSYLFTQLGDVVAAATRHGLLTFAAVESLLNTGAPVLAGLVSKLYQVGQFAGYKADQMLGGGRQPGIDTLQRFSLIVNLAAARTLDAYPPLGLIDHAEFRGNPPN